MRTPRLPGGRIATGPRGAIAAGHPLATSAGLRILQDGGNAMDACLAAAFVAWVVMPDMCGLGGDMFVITRTGASDFRAVTGAGPSAAHGFPSGADTRAHLALVPGAPAAIDTLCASHTSMPLAQLLAPAIAIAEHGFAISGSLARKLDGLAAGRFRTELLEQWGVSSPDEGSVVRWPVLAATLRRLAEAKSAVEPLLPAVPEWRARDVLIDTSDVEAYRAPSLAPLSMSIGGWKIFGQPPMSQAVATMGALGRAGPDALIEPDGAFKAHMMIEAYKQAYARLDDFGHAGDVDAVCKTLLDASAARADREAIGPQASDGPLMSRNYGETTHCAAVDGSGGTATLIHSLYRPFGARVFSPATGLLANDRGASFTSGANAMAPAARPRHTLVNLVAQSPHGTTYALGTPGAQAQTQTNLQILARLMTDPDGLAQAVLAPRWSFIGGRRVACEADVPEDIMHGLQRIGHEIGLRPPRDWLMGSVSLVAARNAGPCSAVADDRRDGLALAT